MWRKVIDPALVQYNFFGLTVCSRVDKADVVTANLFVGSLVGVFVIHSVYAVKSVNLFIFSSLFKKLTVTPMKLKILFCASRKAAMNHLFLNGIPSAV